MMLLLAREAMLGYSRRPGTTTSLALMSFDIPRNTNHHLQEHFQLRHLTAKSNKRAKSNRGMYVGCLKKANANASRRGFVWGTSDQDRLPRSTYNNRGLGIQLRTTDQ